jgi:Tfp pilus assembly protein PilO
MTRIPLQRLQRLDRIGMVVLILAVLCCGYWAFNDIHRTRRQFRIEKNLLSKKLQEINLAQNNLGDLKAVLQKTGEELTYLNQRIPESGKIGLLLQQIDALLRKHRVRLISIHPLPVVEEKIYRRNPLRLIFEGDFADVFRLLTDIERMNRIVIMDHMIITRDRPADPCRVELNANVYERKPDGLLQLNRVTQ